MKFKLRNVLAYFVAWVFILIGLVNRAKKKALKGDFILSIYFHNPSKKEFEFIIKWFTKNGFKFIGVDDLKKIINGSMSFPKGAVLLTADDGWASNFANVAEVANNYKIPITIFVPTEAIESGNYWFSYAKKAKRLGMGYLPSKMLKNVPNAERLAVITEIKKKINLPREAMTISEIQSIAASPWISIGGHSHTHPILPNCSDDELESEITVNKKKVFAWINYQIDTFAYPNGDYGVREMNALKKEDFQIGFSNKPEYLSPQSLNSKFNLPRIGILEGASKAENICRMVGVWHKNTLKVF
ncbi:polysaccharide deacetylase family protein [Cyclobacterium sp. 1_MG-2023]|uniref:polysaccharide deacetylase family protein n=1 Tax=Cyclobacterium sp. 1_MG-2023 TaxID=3062681 RepID=UPI0026E19B42|nr:polysaccharide deacetylase family protein [Cyclobacterium sp. 1_MG-2023]MDO6440361.1 polysaccharide deacetylase family protein [Cyclobacterium sp. 1_MG-2023]